jgi:hypothetical protein
MQDTKCAMLWMSQSYRANGDIRVCCQAQHGPTGGILKDENGKVLNAKDANLQDIRNAPLAKEIRKAMLEGKRHPECIRCHTEEDAGMLSRRQVENKLWIKGGWNQIKEEDKYTWEQLEENTNEDGSIETDKIGNAFFDVRFGNLCNLKCRMCGPTDSNMWYEDQVKLWGNTYKDSHGTVQLIKNEKGKHVPEVNVYDWHESDHYWKQMESQIPSIKKLYIVGGEPLMIDQHYAFLQKCVDQGCAKDIVVEYNSNITNIPERAWSIWKHFRQIGIGASIDAVGDLNRYIRYPSNFNKIWENLNKLSKADGNFRIWYATTISIYNVLHLPEFLKFVIQNQLKRVNDDDLKPLITPHPLHGPQFLNIRALPKDVKKYVTQFYKDSVDGLDKEIDLHIKDETRKSACKKYMRKILKTYDEFMWAKDFTDKLPKFWEHTRKLDTIRGHSFEKSCPEMYKLLQEYEHETTP